ncbi:TPA: Leucine-rich repeat receptor-like serine/threonine-protein kinase bam2 [Trebouxia sp. C0005]
MSAASHLASVLRPPLDPNAPSQNTPQAESQQLPFDQAAASLANTDALLGSHEPTKASPSEPITPTLGGPSGAAPLPTSWPTAQNPPAHHDSQPDVDARKQQGQPQQQTGSLAQAGSSGETAVLPTVAPSDDMTVEQPEVSSSSHVDAGDLVIGTQHTNKHSTEPPVASTRQQKPESGHASAQPDSMQFRPPDEKDVSAAQSAAPREASAGTQAQGRSQWQPAGRPVEVSLKIAGVHWWYNSRSHAAEMTAGYYNSEVHDGYAGILEMCAQHGMVVTLTCVEMCDAQHPPEALCGPEGLLRQVREGAAAAGVLLGGENALPCFVPGGVDQYALDRIVYNTKPWSPPLQMDTMANQMQSQEGYSEGSVTEDPGLSAAFWQERYGDSAVGPVRTLPVMRSFTFLRLIPDMMSPEYQSIWFRFMQQMQQTPLTE